MVTQYSRTRKTVNGNTTATRKMANGNPTQYLGGMWSELVEWGGSYVLRTL